MSLTPRFLLTITIALLAPTAWAGSVVSQGQHRLDRFIQLGWNWESWVLMCLGLAVFGYVFGLCRMGAVRRARIFGATRIGMFLGGIAVLFVALVSPLDGLDDQLAAAHMVQHMLLMLVVPPLLVQSRPIMAWLWAFPLPARRVIGRFWVDTPIGQGFRILMHPLTVWLLCVFVLWFWHLPGPYDSTLASESLHSFEHFCFFGTSLMFWTLVIAPYGRRQLDLGMSMLFVAAFSVQMGMLGAVLTFATRPLYVVYAHTTSVWGLTPLEDQQLAGLIMWVPTSLIHLTTLAVLFVAWMKSAEAHVRSIAPKLPLAVLRSSVIVPLLLFVVTLSACDRQASVEAWQVPGGHMERGPALLRQYGCSSCHTIPGVRDANGNVGPSLTGFSRRIYIAGMLRNTPDNLIVWIRTPQKVVPGNAMPDMNVSEQDARDIAAYLYTLK